MRLAVGVNDRPCSRLAPRNGDMVRTPIVERTSETSQSITTNFLHIKSHASYVQYASKLGLWLVVIGIEERESCFKKKLLQAKTPFLGSGNQKEELRLCKNPAPEGKTRKGQKSAVFVGKGFLVSLYVCFSCFKIPEGPQENLCCRKKKGPYWIWIQCTIMWNVNLAVGLLW